MPAQLAVIVLNYRTPGLTVDCLASLEPEIEPGITVVVVDNASGDGSAEILQRAVVERGWAKWARVISSPVNGGFAAGNNLGIRSVEAAAYLLLNSDTLVRRGALRSLLQAMEAHPDAGAIGSALLGTDGTREHSAFRLIHPVSELIRSANLGPLTRAMHRFHVVGPLAEAPEEAGWVSFACVLLRAEAIHEVGPLDEGFFMYFEDVDYCRRVHRSRWKVLTWPSALVVHLAAGHSGPMSGEAARRRLPRYYYAARARYFAKYYGRAGLWLANLLWHLGRGPAFVRRHLGRPDTPREREFLDIWTNALHPLRTGQPSAR
ncbi:MAG TPA: glycosyltransferase family 2 protein [Anaeromyxobacter sp.]|nr:glycosyltransferase family 2 protein [Anaeromyxobacter sp.]HVP60676.1 glycosyltransferase family 2 protein [Myxococcaceae bacterium]